MKKHRFALRYNRAHHTEPNHRKSERVRTDLERSPDEIGEMKKKRRLRHGDEKDTAIEKTLDTQSLISDEQPAEENSVKQKRLRERRHSAFSGEKDRLEGIRKPGGTAEQVFELDDADEPNESEDTTLSGDSIARRKRQRAQAQTFRRAEEKSEETADCIESMVESEDERADALHSENKKSRLIHTDEESRMAQGMGHALRRSMRTAAIPAKAFLHYKMNEADSDNAAIQSVEAGRKSAILLETSLRQDNLHMGSRNNRLNEAARHERAAQTEKRKKDQIRAFQRKKRYKAAAAAKRSESVVTAGGFVDSAKTAFSIPQKAKKAAQSFFSEHKGAIMGVAVIAVLFALVSVSVTSCAALVQGGGTTIVETTYSSLDADIYAVENAYCALENALDAQVNGFERAYPGYDEYNYQIDEIEHNPYHLISYLQVKYGGFVWNEEIKAEINRLFALQYQMSKSETSEMRTRVETVTGLRTVIDPQTGQPVEEEYQYEQEVQYEYKVLYSMLMNKHLDMICRNSLTAEQIILYDALNRTYGNRPYLFDLNSLGSGGSAGINYTIPPEALSDEKFANLIREAEKYLGYPYVWGGKSPRTSFDCSGFVCWAINHCANNWDVGQKRAKELCKMCIYVSPSEARPGDLIFFEKTYETTGASHVGIYVGEGIMLHCGNPIKYSSINTRYFKQHFLCFGRLPFYD